MRNLRNRLKEEPAAPYRRELQEMVHFEKYDMGKFRSEKEILTFLEKLLDHRKEQSKPAKPTEAS